MKKTYLQPEIRVNCVTGKDILTASPVSEDLRNYDFAIFSLN